MARSLLIASVATLALFAVAPLFFPGAPFILLAFLTTPIALVFLAVLFFVNQVQA